MEVDRERYARTAFQPLQQAIRTGDRETILRAIPEPPQFLRHIFAMPAIDRAEILAGVVPLFETEEDIWELVEAAAMNDRVRPEERALTSVAPFLPSEILPDAVTAAEEIPDADASQDTLTALQRRARILGLPTDL